MTPNSTDRLGALSPLESFLAQGNPPASLKAAQAFESVLNRATGSTGIVSFHAPPTQARSAADRSQNSSLPASRPRSDDTRPTASSSKQEDAGVVRSRQSRPVPKEEDKERDSAEKAAAIRNDAAAPPAESTTPIVQSEQAASNGEEQGGLVHPHCGDGGEQQQAQVLDELMKTVSQQVEAGTESESQPEAGKTSVQEGAISVEDKAAFTSPEPSSLDQLEIEGIAETRAEGSAPTEGQKIIAPQSLASQEKTAVDGSLSAADASLEVTAEVSPAEQSGKGGGNRTGADESNKNDVASIVNPMNDPDAAVSPMDQVPAAAQDAAAAGIQAAASPQAAPEAQVGTATPPTGSVAGSTSRLPSHVLATAESRRGRAAAPVVVDNARFLSRVAKAFISAEQRGGEVRLRLSPPELGSLRLQVSVQDGVMVARMETETEAARAQLTNSLPDLRERLAEQGIRVERFDIDLMQRPSMGTPDRPGDPQQQHEPQPLRSLRTDQARPESDMPAVSNNNWSGQGRLNVIV